MAAYNKCSVIVDRKVFKDSSLLESTSHKGLPKNRIQFDISSLSDYINLIDTLEGQNFVISDNGISYLVEGDIAVKV